MPKIIELTVELDVQKVSCPGVWLCQDGRVSLTVFALGSSYQTGLLPPLFPLMFKDVFYFRKRFQESCALNNICCLLKEETIYCELVQWCNGCVGECVVLAQYLGSLNDVLFPPNMCSNDGVDLLMRRSKQFPGILSPKIEIATKVRIDEVWHQECKMPSAIKVSTCQCPPRRREDFKNEMQPQHPACHTARYHRNRCSNRGRTTSGSRSKTRSESTGSRSCSSLTPKVADHRIITCSCHKNVAETRSRSPKSCMVSPRCVPPLRCMPSPCHSPRLPRRCHQFCVYNVHTKLDAWCLDTERDDDHRSIDSTEELYFNHQDDGDDLPKTTLESRYIEQDKFTNTSVNKKCFLPKISPCICEICKRYHELFHMTSKSG